MFEQLSSQIMPFLQIEHLSTQLVPLLQVIMIDLVLAGDNAIVVGLAASRVAPSMRAKVIFWGIAGAVVLRLLFALVASQLLQIVGLLLAGGILLLWVCWKMYREINDHGPVPHSLGAAAVSDARPVAQMSAFAALWQIIVADVSMSLDNVLAVAGAAKGNTTVLVIGLAVAVVLMAVAATYVAKLLASYPWVSWIGLAIILFVALDMIWSGSHEVICAFVPGETCRASLLNGLTLLLAKF
jgi:YjbE family integral membrane protein